MTTSCQFGDVDAHGATIRARAMALEPEYQAIVCDVLTAEDFWGDAGSTACQQFITELGRNFQVIYEQANARGSKVQTRRSQHGQHPTTPWVPAGPKNIAMDPETFHGRAHMRLKQIEHLLKTEQIDERLDWLWDAENGAA